MKAMIAQTPITSPPQTVRATSRAQTRLGCRTPGRSRSASSTAGTSRKTASCSRIIATRPPSSAERDPRAPRPPLARAIPDGEERRDREPRRRMGVGRREVAVEERRCAQPDDRAKPRTRPTRSVICRASQIGEHERDTGIDRRAERDGPDIGEAVAVRGDVEARARGADGRSHLRRRRRAPRGSPSRTGHC